MLSNAQNPDSDLVAFLAGDRNAGTRLYKCLYPSLLRQARRRLGNLPVDLAGDVVDEVFALMIERQVTFDPAKSSAKTFISATLLLEAVRRVRAENSSAGTPKRHRNSGAAKHTAAASLEDAPHVQATGYSTPEAVEAICDTHVIWARATASMRVVIDGMKEEKSKDEIATDLKTNRFTVGRMIKRVQKQFAAAA